MDREYTGMNRVACAIINLCVLVGCMPVRVAPTESNVPGTPYTIVLGVAQDAGYPQTACRRACCEAARRDPKLKRHVACLAIVDPVNRQRWIVDCTPDFREQLAMLDAMAPSHSPDATALISQPLLDGILLTHAHIGHYTGLQDLGREVTGAHEVPLYVMPRMAEFLRTNGPWNQLVELHNVQLHLLSADQPTALNEHITATPLVVPHRDEYSETVGYRITGPTRSVLYIPDVDKWQRWDRLIEDEIAKVDVAYLDGTFFDGEELGGRDMAEIPHPFVRESMARFAALSIGERAKIRFIHFNHTNALLRSGSNVCREVEAAGLRASSQGDIEPL